MILSLVMKDRSFVVAIKNLRDTTMDTNIYCLAHKETVKDPTA